MDIAIHAQLMAGTCTFPFGQLILEVPHRFAGEDHLSMGLISFLAHANCMATSCRSERADSMIYAVAEKVLDVASVDRFDVPKQAATTVIQTIGHASAMGKCVSEVAEDMFAVVQPLVDQPLPKQLRGLVDLSNQQRAVCAEIHHISHSALMERMRQQIRR